MTVTEIDLLVRADYLYPMSEGLPIITDAEVAIAGGRILYAGPRRPDGTWQAQETLAGENRAVLPGLVNGHTHASDLLFRGQMDDNTGTANLYTIAFQIEKDITPEEWHAMARLGCVDMLRSGVTTLHDMMYSPESLALAVEESGIRAIIADTIYDVPMAELKDGRYEHDAVAGERRLRDQVDFASRWQGRAGGRIATRVAPHATDTCSAALLKAARAEATRLGIGMHLHGAQSPREVAYIKSAHGCGPIEFLRDIGLLAPDVGVAHLSFATDADFDAMSETGAAYLHCPTVYARKGRYPRLEAAMARKLPTAFATDWLMNDPWEGMRFAMNAIRLKLSDPDILPAAEALRFFTIDAARALGMGGEIGSLEAGKRADLIMLDLDRTHMQPFHGAYPALVWYAKSTDVVTSIIEGQVVLRDGHVVLASEEEILADVARRAPVWRARLAELGVPTVVIPRHA